MKIGIRLSVRKCQISKTNAYRVTWKSHLSNHFCQISLTVPYSWACVDDWSLVYNSASSMRWSISQLWSIYCYSYVPISDNIFLAIKWMSYTIFIKLDFIWFQIGLLRLISNLDTEITLILSDILQRFLSLVKIFAIHVKWKTNLFTAIGSKFYQLFEFWLKFW